jgi:hypothetical protein
MVMSVATTGGVRGGNILTSMDPHWLLYKWELSYNFMYPRS